MKTNIKMFIIGNIKHENIITRIKLNLVSFARHYRIFLVVG